MKINQKISKLLIYFFFLAIPLIYHNIAYIGHFGFDDMQYAKLANDLNHNKIDYNDHFSYRWTIITATALSYKLFGVNDFASALPSMILNLLIISLIFFVLYNEQPKHIIIGLALYVLNPVTLFWSDKLMPDIYISFSILLTILSIYFYKFKNPKKRTIPYSVLFSVSIFFGFISKGTIVFVLPLVLILFVIDIANKKHLKFWAFSFLFILLLLITYFASFEIMYGNAFIRFKAMANNSYLNLCSYDKQPVEFLLRRISYELIFELIKQAIFFGLIFVFAAIISKRIKHHLNPNNKDSFFIFSSLILFLSANFMSISYNHYVPMCPDVRHYMFLVPVFSIASAPVIASFIENNKYKLQIIALLSITTLAAYLNHYKSFKTLYFPMLVLFLVFAFLPKKKPIINIFITLFVLILSISHIKPILYARNTVKYNKQKELIMNNIINNPQINSDYIIITNSAQKRICNYYNAFKNNLKFIEFSEIDSTDFSNKKIIILRNKYSEYLSMLKEEDIPFEAKDINHTFRTIASNDDLHLYIYETSHLAQFDTIFSTTNGFETKKLKNWHYNPDLLEDNIVKNGKYSYKVKEYSASFGANLNGISIPNKKLYINTRFFIWQKDIGKVKLVIEIKNGNKTVIWKGYDIGRYLRSYGNWCEINLKREINIIKADRNSTLKIYLWNIDKKEIYIDDFSILVLKSKETR